MTEEECLKALKSFKTNKSPGCDGIPAEFYLTFWNQIGEKLVKTLNYCCKKRHFISLAKTWCNNFVREKRKKSIQNKKLAPSGPS